jgi:hypothetical protein
MRKPTLSLTRNLCSTRYKCLSPLNRPIHSTPLENLLLKSIQVCTNLLEHEELAHTLAQATGPLTVAQYMRTCLSHPVEGYYMKGDVFGAQGDFITSPEISQTFGEVCN